MIYVKVGWGVHDFSIKSRKNDNLTVLLLQTPLPMGFSLVTFYVQKTSWNINFFILHIAPSTSFLIHVYQ